MSFTPVTNPQPVTVDAGTLMQRIEMLEILIAQLLHGAAGQPPDSSGHTRVAFDNNTLATVSSVGAVTTITNPVVIAGQLPNLAALELRNQIKVT